MRELIFLKVQNMNVEPKRGGSADLRNNIAKCYCMNYNEKRGDKEWK